MSNLTRRNFLLTTGVAAISSACPALATPNRAELNLSFGNAYWEDLFQQVVDAYTASRKDVQINLRPMADEPKLAQSILRGAVVDDLPDLAFQGYGQMRNTIDADIALDLDDLIASEEDWASIGYAKSIADMGRVKGKTFAIPFWSSAPVMYYNLDMMEKAGADPDELPTDWSNLIRLANNMRQATGDRQRFHYIYNNTDWNFQSLLFSEGGRLMSPDEQTIAFDSHEGLAALELLEEFGKNGMIAMSRDQARQGFGAGELGILGGNSSSHLKRLRSQAEGNFRLGVAPHPMPSPQGKLPSGGGGFLILSKDKNKQAAAWDFMKFATGPVGQTIMVKKTGAIPVNQRAIQEEEFLGGYYRDQPTQKKILQALNSLTAWYAFPGKNANKIVTEIVNTADLAVRMKDTPENLLSALKEQVSSLL